MSWNTRKTFVLSRKDKSGNYAIIVPKDINFDSKVAILLEDLRSQFKIFGEGLEMLNNKVDKGFLQLNTRLDRHIAENRQEHQKMIQMIKDLNEEQNELKKIK